MLVARINRPGAQLVLENAPSTPKIDQTTMLRIILPLKQDRPIPGARPPGPASRTRSSRTRLRGGDRAAPLPFGQPFRIKSTIDTKANRDDRDPRTDQDVRRALRPGSAEPHAPSGRRLRFHRSQRRGQDHDHADPGHAPEPELGRGHRLRLLDLHRIQGDPPGHRLHARFLRRVRRHEGDRVPRVLRVGLPDQGPCAAEDLRGSAGAGRPDLQARCAGDESLSRHDPAAGPGPDLAPRSPGAAPGRARLGP